MGSDKFYEDPAFLVVYFSDQAIIIMVDLKDCTVIFNGPRSIKIPRKFSGLLPVF